MESSPAANPAHPFPSPRSDHSLARSASLLAQAVAVLALVGWAAGTPELASWYASWPAMKVNAALGVLLLGQAQWAALRSTDGPMSVRASALYAETAAALATMLAGLTLWQTLSGTSLGLDELLAQDRAAAPGTSPGRMASTTALAIVALGAGLLAQLRPRGDARAHPSPAAHARPFRNPSTEGIRRSPPALSRSEWLPAGLRLAPPLLAAALAYIGLIGLLLGANWQHGSLVAFTGMSMPSAVTVLALAVAQLSIQRHDNPILAALDARHPGAAFLRATLPMALLMPLLAEWLDLRGQRMGWWEPDVGRALVVVAVSAGVGLVIWRGARRIWAQDAALRASHSMLETRVAERTTELAEAVLELSASRQQLEAVVASVTTAIITVDEARRIVLFNASAEHMFGRTAHEMLGQPLDTLLPERFRTAQALHMREFGRTGVTRSMTGRSAELSGLRADGSEFPMEAWISQVESGGQRLMTVALRDLTESRRLAAAEQARASAEAASRAKTDFLSRVSHELRTPLNAVLGFAQLAQIDRDHPLPPVQQERLAQVIESGQHLVMLINDLLDLGRIESGNLRMQPTMLDLRAHVQDVLRVVRGQAVVAGIRIEMDPGITPVPAYADSGRLRQVLTNLLTNAIKYNRAHGRVQIGLALQACDNGPRATVTISDTGIGLTEEQRAHLFEPFNRLGREGGPVEGTGIGLVLARHLVQLMGGDIGVTSIAGSGSTFRIELPAQPPTQAAAPPTSSPGHAPSQAPAPDAPWP